MLVQKYRSKPTEIEAVLFDGENLEELQQFTGDQFSLVAEEDRGDDPDIIAQVFDTLHSTWVGVKDGQWIIKGTKGEFYPCDPDVFEQKYEKLIEEKA